MEIKYIENVSNNTYLQEVWKPKIGDLILPTAAKIPASAIWSERVNKEIRIHALNESDIIFLDHTVKHNFAWIPRATDLIEVLTSYKKVTLDQILEYASKTALPTLEERIYSHFVVLS